MVMALVALPAALLIRFGKNKLEALTGPLSDVAQWCIGVGLVLAVYFMLYLAWEKLFQAG